MYRVITFLVLSNVSFCRINLYILADIESVPLDKRWLLSVDAQTEKWKQSKLIFVSNEWMIKRLEHCHT